MNKEVLATILGVAGLSLLKKVSGSSNDLGLQDSLGFLWFEVEISDQVSDFNIDHFVELLNKAKKFADEHKGMDADEIFRYHGADEYEDGEILFPDGVDGEIALVLRGPFNEYAATAIMGVYCDGDFEDERTLERFISDGSYIQEIIPVSPKKLFIQINILNIIKNGYEDSLGSVILSVEELINNFINVYVLTQIVEEKRINYEMDRWEDWGSIIEPVVDVDYYELPARFSVSPVKPKDPMIANALFRGNSDIRKF